MRQINGRQRVRLSAPWKIRKILEEEGPILLRHWFYRGGSAPEYMVFDDYDKLLNYLNSEAYAGDAIDIWNVWQIVILKTGQWKGSVLMKMD